MKKIILSIMMVFALLSSTNGIALAQTRSQEQSKTIAKKKLLADDAILSIENEAFSVYNSTDGKGFVIVSADEKLPEVLGYADSGSFDPDDIPTGLKFWMDKTLQACNAVAAGTLSASELFATVEPSNEIEPLLGEIAWDQDEPYNLKCPTIDGKLCPSGCVATALSMLMKYYRYPERGTGIVEYTTSSKKIPVSYDFSKTVFDYDNMLDSYSLPALKGSNKVNIDKDLASDVVCVRLLPAFSNGGVSVYADTLMFVKGGSFTGTIQFMLFSKDGEYLENVGEANDFSEIPTKAYYKRYDFMVTMPEKYPDGKYDLYLGSKTADNLSWALVGGYNPVSKRRTAPKPIEITKQGKKVFVGKYSGFVPYQAHEADAVAELMAACGAAVEMDYDKESSGASAFSPFYKAIEHFGYDRDVFFCDGNIMSYKDMNTTIIAQVEDGYPVYVGGSAKNSNSGHAFIADGVRYTNQGNPMFHINWGWGGKCNGYFLVNNFSPVLSGIGGGNNDNYSEQMELFCGIKPDDGIEEAPALSYSSIETDKKDVTVGDKITVKFTELTNASAYTANCSMTVFLVDSDNNELELTTSDPFELPSLHYYKETTVKASIRTDIPSGSYKLIARFCTGTADKKYGRCLTSKKTTINVSNPTGITAVVDDDSPATGNEHAYDLNGRLSKEEGVFVKDGKVRIKN